MDFANSASPSPSPSPGDGNGDSNFVQGGIISFMFVGCLRPAGRGILETECSQRVAEEYLNDLINISLE